MTPQGAYVHHAPHLFSLMNLFLSSSSFSSVTSRVGSDRVGSLMQMQFRNRVVSFSGSNHFFARQNPLPVQAQNLPQTLEMVTESGHSKRPMCPSCSKPTRLCLCTRLKTPCLENSVAVTILQHSLEKNHPLNSTRIASIGLKNLSVISVSDVNYEAEFVIRLLNSNLEMGSQILGENLSCTDSSPLMSHPCRVLQKDPTFRESDMHLLTFLKSSNNIGENSSSINIKDSNFDSNATVSFTIEKSFLKSSSNIGENSSSINIKDSNFDSNAGVSFTIEKYGTICPSQNQDLNKLLASRAAIDDIQKGFLVKKLQRKLLDGSSEFQELKEFEITVPSGSVLLFPSEDSIGTEEIDFEVKNLIVLDGTWAKAKRMYNENPWLKMLPHLRLDVEKLSLYSEVRRQPRAGYLSTIESIVYALKAVGEKDSEGLDHLLDVFESMVVDQRRCKDEGLRQRFSNCD